METMANESYFENGAGESTIRTIRVFPPTNWDDERILVIAGVYSVLFLIGLCGNSGILAVVAIVRSSAATDNAFIYISCLCCVDLVIMLSLPLSIMDQILGFWMFGTFLCKFYWLLESVGKLLSTFILTAMSFDRFVGVCYPHKTSMRSRKAAVSVLLLSGIAAILLLSPLLYSASAAELMLPGLPPVYNRARQSVTIIRVIKCVTNLQRMLTAFSIYTFVIGHVLPFVLMTIFYSKMLRALQKHKRTLRRSQIPLRSIALHTLAICCFYFLCWTPYWVSMLYQIYIENSHTRGTYEPPIEYVYFMYCIHALPYVNAAGNWLLYGLLNRQLHQRSASSSESKSHERTTLLKTHSNVTTNKMIANGIYHRFKWEKNKPSSTPMLSNGFSMESYPAKIIDNNIVTFV